MSVAFIVGNIANTQAKGNPLIERIKSVKETYPVASDKGELANEKRPFDDGVDDLLESPSIDVIEPFE